MEHAAKIQLVLSFQILPGIARWLMLIKIWLFHSAQSEKVSVDHQIFINSEILLTILKTLQSKDWQKEKSATLK